MTTPRFSSEARERKPFADKHAFFNPVYFRGEMRRSWPKTLCLTLFFFFVLPLPLLFQVNSRRSWSADALTTAMIRLPISNLWLYCFAAVAAAVFVGMLTTRYLNRRTVVDFYHSLPMRREGLLISNVLAGLLQFAAALVINTLLSLIILLSVAEMLNPVGVAVLRLLTAVGYIALTFLLFYTITVFCGMLCGTSVMQVMVVALFVGAFPLFRVLLISFLSDVTYHIDISSMWRDDWGWTSPLLRLFTLTGTDRIDYGHYTDCVLDFPLLWWEILAWLAAAWLLLLGAFLLYRRRRVERAGTPVVFDGVASAVRWIVVVLGTMGMGWLFHALGDGIFWLFFGFLLGGFLAFILMGAILTKTPRRMFEGWRRMLAFLVLFCLLFLGLMLAISAIDERIPKKIDRIALYFENDNYNVPYYEDPAVIAAWQALWSEAPAEEDYLLLNYYDEAMGDKEIIVEEKYDQMHYYFHDGARVSIRAYVKIGPLVIPYRSKYYRTAQAEELIRAVTESAEFEAGWDSIMARIGEAGAYPHDPMRYEGMLDPPDSRDPRATVAMYDMMTNLYAARHGLSVTRMMGSRHYRNIMAPVGAYTLDGILADCADVDYDFFQSPAYASLDSDMFERSEEPRMSDGIPSNSMFYLPLPIEASSLYREALGMSEEEFYGAMADEILATKGRLYVAKRVQYAFTLQDACVMEVTDRGRIIEILRGLTTLDFDGYTSEISNFTVVDERYGVVFPDGLSDSVVYMIKGKVPGFVMDALGG